VTDFDSSLVAPYNGYKDVDHYYKSMSAAGDWGGIDDPGTIGDVKVPLAIGEMRRND